MATTRERMRNWSGPALFSYGFRPFFLGAALWAALAMALWAAMMAGAEPLPLAYDPVSWHAHEFLFGYLGAVIAGFLLTAVPNWTGRLPVVGWSLAVLAGFWLAGRVAIATSGFWPPGWVAATDLAFQALLVLYLSREILAGRNWKNLIILGLLLAFLAGNLLFHRDAMAGRLSPDAVGIRLALATSILLIAVIGGRIVPSFTRNWLVKRGDPRRPAAPMQLFDRLSLIALLLALLLWVLRPDHPATGAALLAGGALHLARLARWQGLATLREPLLWVLHLAYAFVPLGTLTLGAALFSDSFQLATGSLHIWTIGAIGLMTLAVMTRATLGHTGAALQAGVLTATLYLALPAALACRLAAAIAPDPDPFFAAASLLWIVAFLGFAALYGPRLLRARKPGG